MLRCLVGNIKERTRIHSYFHCGTLKIDQALDGRNAKNVFFSANERSTGEGKEEEGEGKLEVKLCLGRRSIANLQMSTNCAIEKSIDRPKSTYCVKTRLSTRQELSNDELCNCGGFEKSQWNRQGD